MKILLDGNEVSVQDMKGLLDSGDMMNSEVVELVNIDNDAMYFETHIYGSYY